MALLKYFKRIERSADEQIESVLPKANGALSQLMPSSSIAAANSEVRKIMKDKGESGMGSRGKYQHHTEKEKAAIAKKALECGIVKTISHYAKIDPERTLSPSTVHTWKTKYVQELAKRRREKDITTEIKELPNKKRGRPLMLGAELDSQVETFLKELRSNGGVVNTAITMAAAEGIVQNSDSQLLAKNGGNIVISTHWAKSLLARMGFVKRRVTTKAKVSVNEFEEHKEQFLFDTKAIIQMEDIPDSLIINWDHTGIHYVPVGAWTMEKEGSKRVEIKGTDDKRQITAVLAITMSGHYLPPQIIYQGKTRKCLPVIKFPSNWHITFTENHWANELTTLQYIDAILLPYVKQKREELKRPNHPCLVIFDRFKAQCTTTVLEVLEENNIFISLIPAHCTDRLQPLDISVNRSVKQFLRNQFHEWYASKIQTHLQKFGKVQDVDLRLNIVKPLSATWMIKLFDYLLLNPEIARNGFRNAGFTV